MTTQMQNEFDGHAVDFFVCGRRYYANLLVLDTFSELTPENLADEIYLVFGKKWERFFNVLRSEYNPLENYNMREIMNDFSKHSGDETSFSGFGESETGVSGTGVTIRSGKNISGVSMTNGNVNVTEDNGDMPKQTAYKTTYENQSTDRKTDMTETNGDTATKTLNTYQINRDKHGTETHNKTGINKNIDGNDILYSGVDADNITELTGHIGERTGNIGVMTTQQMLEQELQIADRDLIVTIIVRDIAEHISSGVYA